MERISENSNGLAGAGEVRPEQTDHARREVLATIGRFAYVAPALVLLAEPKFARRLWPRRRQRRRRQQQHRGWRQWGVQAPQAPSQRRPLVEVLVITGS
jgi:hypothetical protein